jgi:hypothetical protein
LSTPAPQSFLRPNSGANDNSANVKTTIRLEIESRSSKLLFPSAFALGLWCSGLGLWQSALLLTEKPALTPRSNAWTALRLAIIAPRSIQAAPARSNHLYYSSSVTQQNGSRNHYMPSLPTTNCNLSTVSISPASRKHRPVDGSGKSCNELCPVSRKIGPRHSGRQRPWNRQKSKNSPNK